MSTNAGGNGGAIPFLMNGLQLGFLKITESVEHFLPFLSPEGGQDIQDFR
jgi:hypothetical protein